MGLIIDRDHVIDVLSQTSVDSLVDDLVNPTDLDEIDKNIQWAESRVLGKLVLFFSATQLRLSPHVQKLTAYYACYLLTKRRGNPHLYGEAEENLDEMLDQILAEEIQLVDANGNILAKDNSTVPIAISQQNLLVDENDPFNRIKTIPQSSSVKNPSNSYIQRRKDYVWYR